MYLKKNLRVLVRIFFSILGLLLLPILLIATQSQASQKEDPLENLCETALVKYLYQGELTRHTEFLAGVDKIKNDALANGSASIAIKSTDSDFGDIIFTRELIIDSNAIDAQSVRQWLGRAIYHTESQRRSFTKLRLLQIIRDWAEKIIGNEKEFKVLLEGDIPYAVTLLRGHDKLESPWINRDAIPEKVLEAFGYTYTFVDPNQLIHYQVYGGESPKLEFSNPNGKATVYFRSTERGLEPAMIEVNWNENRAYASESVRFEGKPFDILVKTFNEKAQFLIDQQNLERKQAEEANLRAMKSSDGAYSILTRDVATAPSGAQVFGNGPMNKQIIFIVGSEVPSMSRKLIFDMADSPRPTRFQINGLQYDVNYMRDGVITLNGGAGSYEKFIKVDSDGVQMPMIKVTLNLLD